MKNGHTRERMRRLASLLLAVVVAVTFMPFLDDGSYAETNKKPNEKVKYIEKKADGTEVELDPEIFEGDGEILNPDDATLEKLGINFSAEPPSNGEMPKSVTDEDEESDVEPVGSDPIITDQDTLSELYASGLSLEKISASNDTDEETSEDAADTEEPLNGLSETVDSEHAESLPEETTQRIKASGDISAKDLVSTAYCSLDATPNYSTSVVNVSASIRKDKVSEYRISTWGLFDGRGTLVGAASVYGTSFSYPLNMRDFPTGYYDIMVIVQKKTNNTWSDYGYNLKEDIQFDYVSVTPDTGGSYEAYSTYFNYQKWDPRYIQGYRLYIDYWASGGGVTTKYMENYYTTYTFGGLAPDTVYNIRFRYGLPAHGTVMYGPYSGTTAIRTGIASLPKIKSIKVKAYKVKKRRAGVYGWYTGYYFGSVRYYTYKIKVTVQFKTKKKKKKPGLNGLYINGTWKPGNKKKYTLKLGPYANYSKPKGKKFIVTLYSAHSPGGYGGYSPMYSKTKKVK